MIVGITGRGGSGKTTLAKRIVKKNSNFIYVDVDNIIETRVMTSSTLIENVNFYFSDKKYLIKDIILAYFKKTEKNNILHRFFLEEVARQINMILYENKGKNYVIDWFLLHEIFELLPLDYKILTIASKRERYNRVEKREKTTDMEVFKNVDNAFVEVDMKCIDLVIDTENDYTGIINNIFNNGRVGKVK